MECNYVQLPKYFQGNILLFTQLHLSDSFSYQLFYKLPFFLHTKHKSLVLN